MTERATTSRMLFYFKRILRQEDSTGGLKCTNLKHVKKEVIRSSNLTGGGSLNKKIIYKEQFIENELAT